MNTTNTTEKLAASRAEFATVTAGFTPDVKAKLAQAMLYIQHVTAAEVPRAIAQQMCMYSDTVGRVVADMPQEDQQRVANMMANAQLAAVAAVSAALADLSFSDPQPAPLGDIMDTLFEVNARNTKELLPPL